MKRTAPQPQTWLDLSDAADYLGVHFTTLRRWADAGEIDFLRTPGGRRRFSVSALDAFLQRLSRMGTPAERAGGPVEPAPPESSLVAAGLQNRAIDRTRSSIRDLPVHGGWMDRLSPETRQALRGSGNRLMALLLQYNSRSEGGETFLEEARRIARQYGSVCAEVGLSLQETTGIFLFFRRSVLDSIHETGSLWSGSDPEGFRLYRRTNDFFDAMLVDLVGPAAGTQATSDNNE